MSKSEFARERIFDAPPPIKVPEGSTAEEVLADIAAKRDKLAANKEKENK